MSDLFDFLRRRLQEGLPGNDAHLSMAPLFEGKPYRPFMPGPNASSSAVLVLLYPDSNGSFELLLTLRSDSLKNHNNQMSFAGGRAEDEENSIQTALREASEEIGLDPREVEIAGTMSTLFVPPSNSVITPVVGFIEKLPELIINKSEVDTVHSVSLSFLADKNNITREIWNFNGRDVDVPFWNIDAPVPLWGATAMILSELIALYHEYQREA